MTPLKHRWAAAALDQSLAATNPASFDMPSLDLFLSTPLLCSTLPYITLPFSTLLHSMLLCSTQLNSTQLYKVSSTLLNSSSLYRYSTLVYSALASATLLYTLLSSPLISAHPFSPSPPPNSITGYSTLLTGYSNLSALLYPIFLYSASLFSTQPAASAKPSKTRSFSTKLPLIVSSIKISNTCIHIHRYMHGAGKLCTCWCPRGAHLTNPKNAHSVLRFNFGKSDLNCVVEEKHTHTHASYRLSAVFAGFEE